MPKQPNKVPVTLARMKMDSSRVHAYHLLKYGKTGYLSEWLPSWLAPYIWWDSNEEEMYYRESDGSRILIPNGYYVVQMPTKWPLVISPAGFEADWFPLSPGDDGYDVLATDNAITRSDEVTHSLEKGSTHSIVQRQNHDYSLESPNNPDKDSELTRGFEALARYGEEESKTQSLEIGTEEQYAEAERVAYHGPIPPVTPWIKNHSIEDLVAYMKVCQRIPFSNWLKGPDDYTPEGLRNLTALLIQSFPEPSPELSDKGAATPDQHPSESQMQRDDRMYEQGYAAGQKAAKSMLVEQSYKDGFEAGYKKGHIDGQEVLSESIFEAIRFIRRDTTQSPESESGGSGREETLVEAAIVDSIIGESGHRSDQATGPSGVYKPRLI